MVKDLRRTNESTYSETLPKSETLKPSLSEVQVAFRQTSAHFAWGHSVVLITTVQIGKVAVLSVNKLSCIVDPWSTTPKPWYQFNDASERKSQLLSFSPLLPFVELKPSPKPHHLRSLLTWQTSQRMLDSPFLLWPVQIRSKVQAILARVRGVKVWAGQFFQHHMGVSSGNRDRVHYGT